MASKEIEQGRLYKSIATSGKTPAKLRDKIRRQADGIKEKGKKREDEKKPT